MSDRNLKYDLPTGFLGVHRFYRRELRSALAEMSRREAFSLCWNAMTDEQWRAAARERVEIAESGVRLVCLGDEEYPALLGTIEDAPLVLLVRGAIRPGRRIAIIGARRATAFGRRFAASMAEALTEEGFQIVSGLAYGVDAAAHHGAIAAANPETGAGIAVLGSGVMHIYPREHEQLAESLLAANGALISEYELNAGPRAWQFPERNRIVSGLCEMVLVVEAELKSGALITAALAAEQGREVCAVPGSPEVRLADGTNLLLKDGARVITAPEDFFDAYPALRARVQRTGSAGTRSSGPRTNPPVATRLSELERAVFEVLHPQLPQEFDEILRLTQKEPALLRQTLFELELRGVVSSDEMGGYLRNQIVDMP